jgi:hypothetical protein
MRKVFKRIKKTIIPKIAQNPDILIFKKIKIRI